MSGPDDFKLIINDLTFTTSYVKYIDDDTVLSISKNVNDDTLQACADHHAHWTQRNGMKINTNKTKETIICFSKKMNTNDILFSYTEVLRRSGLDRLDSQYDMITQSVFTQIKRSNNTHFVTY